jgi:NADH-quinone oxidoreductase subunit L
MMRLVVLTFAGENRASEEVRRHIHESPATMTVPLVVLAVLSVCGGWIGWPHFLGGANHFERWLEPVFHAEAAGAAHGMEAVGHAAAGHAAEAAHVAASTGTEWILMWASLGIAALGLGLGWWIYARRLDLAAGLRGMAGGFVYRVLLNKYWVDELYEALFLRPGYWLSRNVLWQWIDRRVIDGLLVNGSALMVSVTGGLLRLIQNGMIRSYAYAFAVGVAVFVLFLTLSG